MYASPLGSKTLCRMDPWTSLVKSSSVTVLLLTFLYLQDNLAWLNGQCHNARFHDRICVIAWDTLVHNWVEIWLKHRRHLSYYLREFGEELNDKCSWRICFCEFYTWMNREGFKVKIDRIAYTPLLCMFDHSPCAAIRPSKNVLLSNHQICWEHA